MCQSPTHPLHTLHRWMNSDLVNSFVQFDWLERVPGAEREWFRSQDPEPGDHVSSLGAGFLDRLGGGCLGSGVVEILRILHKIGKRLDALRVVVIFFGGGGSGRTR